MYKIYANNNDELLLTVETEEEVREYRVRTWPNSHCYVYKTGNIDIYNELGEQVAHVISHKPTLHGLFRDNPETPEGKYLVKRRDGTVVEWPSFVLGARDPHAAVALRAYAESCKNDPEIDKRFVDRLFRFADQWDQYRKEHGDGDPGKGRHRKDDPATIEEMKKGWSA